MSKNISAKTRKGETVELKDKTPKFETSKKDKPKGIGPFTVVVDVFGPLLDAKGNETRHINPENRVRMKLHDDRRDEWGRQCGTVQGALAKMRTYSVGANGKRVSDPMPFYKIVSVVDHGKEALSGIEVPSEPEDPSYQPGDVVEVDHDFTMDGPLYTNEDFIPDPSVYIDNPVKFVAETEGRN